MFKKAINLFKKNSLLSGSFIVLLGNALGNFASYLYHLLIGRFLGPSDYGLLASLLSLSYYLGIPISVLGWLIVKYVSSKNKEQSWIFGFVKKICLDVFPYACLGFVFFLFTFPWLKNLLKIPSFFLFLGIALNSFLSIYSGVFAAVIQGLKNFEKLTILNIASNWLRLIFGLLAVFWGLKVGGIVYSAIFATLITLFLGYFFVKLPVFSKNKKGELNIEISLDNFKSYFISFLLANISLISLMTADVILARFFLSSLESGYYASLSVLGRIIFFASSPVVSVMFPMVAEQHAQGGRYWRNFFLSFLIIFLISLTISLVYFSFPNPMVRILFGENYLPSAKFLPYFSLLFSLYSFCYLIVNFFLSISEVKASYLVSFFAIFQVVLIYIFHQNFLQIIKANIFGIFLLFVCLMIYLSKKIISFKNS